MIREATIITEQKLENEPAESEKKIRSFVLYGFSYGSDKYEWSFNKHLSSKTMAQHVCFILW